jgi:hypothetical protein
VIDSTSTTMVGSIAPGANFVVTPADDGAVLRTQPGDSVTVRLPVDDPSGPLWLLTTESDLGFLDIEDSLLWMPSEPGAEPSHFELVVWVTATGQADIVFSLGPPETASTTVTFTIDATDQ